MVKGKSSVKRTATFSTTPLFEPSFRKFAQHCPKLTEKLKIFKDFKSDRPPRVLPAGFSDHTLSGRLQGVGECHLDGNACLLYIDSGGNITLIEIVDHDELEGPKERAVAKRINPYLN